VITGIEKPEILDQAFQAAKTSKPLSSQQLAALLAKTEQVARTGKYELLSLRALRRNGAPSQLARRRRSIGAEAGAGTDGLRSLPARNVFHAGKKTQSLMLVCRCLSHFTWPKFVTTAPW
jgi:hypothetical protein